MPVLIERTRPTRRQLTAVYAYIRRKREKGKQALAESRAKEEEEKQRRREEEKKKETVEDVRKEIAELEAKLCKLKREKHELFLQFKKALNEDEMKKRRLNQTIVPDPRPSLRFQVPASGDFSPLCNNIQGPSAVMESVSDPGYMQSQTVHSQQILQAPHGLYPLQTSDSQSSLQEQFATFQHGPVPASVITSCQDPQQTSQHLKKQQQQQQGQQQQQFVYPVVQQQQEFQENVQHFQQKQPIQPQQQTLTIPYTSQQGFPGQYSQDQSCIQSYPLHDSLLQVQTLQQHQQPYQLHPQPQGYQLQTSAPYHGYHSQQGGQYSGTPEHQLAPEQHYPQQQPQLIQIQNRQMHHSPGRELAEMLPQQQHQKQDLRPGPTAGHSQQYMQEYQQQCQQGPPSVKGGSLKSSVSAFCGSKGPSSSAVKKYSGKYQAMQEAKPSSGLSGTSPSSRKHYPCRGQKGGSGYNATQQKGSRYYQ